MTNASRAVPLNERLRLLFDVSQPYGLPETTRSVADRTGVEASLLDELLTDSGSNPPSDAVLATVASYFLVDSAYLTRPDDDPLVLDYHDDLLNYATVINDGARLVALRSHSHRLSPAAAADLRALICETNDRYGAR